jgi:hypothetical protein
MEKSLVFADLPFDERISLCHEPCFTPFLPSYATARRNGLLVDFCVNGRLSGPRALQLELLHVSLQFPIRLKDSPV